MRLPLLIAKPCHDRTVSHTDRHHMFTTVSFMSLCRTARRHFRQSYCRCPDQNGPDRFSRPHCNYQARQSIGQETKRNETKRNETKRNETKRQKDKDPAQANGEEKQT